jgi:ABC-2 type transport system ATP-binding protein
LEIEFADPPPPASMFENLPGVRQVTAAGATLTVAFEGTADAVVKAAAGHEVRAIRSRDDDLEEIFLRYYRADAPAGPRGEGPG